MFDVLLVEPDESTVGNVTNALDHDDFRVTRVETAELALFEHARRDVDLVITASHLDGMDGIELCRVLKLQAGTPVIVTDRDLSGDRTVAALDAGADDVIAMSAQRGELRARARAVLRRNRGGLRPHRRVRVGALVATWDDEGRFLAEGGPPPTERALVLFELLVERNGIVVGEMAIRHRLAERLPVRDGGAELGPALAELRAAFAHAGAPDALQHVPSGGWRLAP